jgi:hypothetical protein
VVLRLKKSEILQNVKTVKEPIQTKTESQEIEPNPSKDRAMHEEDNPSFLEEFIKSTSFLTVQYIFVFLNKYQITKLITIVTYRYHSQNGM